MAERIPFPAWLRELCYYGGLVVALAVFAFSLKSDQRSTSEKLDRVQIDVAAFSSRLSGIEGRLPNKEAEDLKYKLLVDQVDDLRGDFELEREKDAKYKTDLTKDLIKKGVIE